VVKLTCKTRGARRRADRRVLTILASDTHKHGTIRRVVSNRRVHTRCALVHVVVILAGRARNACRGTVRASISVVTIAARRASSRRIRVVVNRSSCTGHTSSRPGRSILAVVAIHTYCRCTVRLRPIVVVRASNTIRARRLCCCGVLPIVARHTSRASVGVQVSKATGAVSARDQPSGSVLTSRT
jgi:hypothetical protein